MERSEDYFTAADLDRIAVVDESVQELQNLASLYVQLLAIDDRTPSHVAAEIMDGMFQAFARSYLATRHAIATIATTLAGGDTPESPDIPDGDF